MAMRFLQKAKNWREITENAWLLKANDTTLANILEEHKNWQRQLNRSKHRMIRGTFLSVLLIMGCWQNNLTTRFASMFVLASTTAMLAKTIKDEDDANFQIYHLGQLIQERSEAANDRTQQLRP